MHGTMLLSEKMNFINFPFCRCVDNLCGKVNVTGLTVAASAFIYCRLIFLQFIYCLKNVPNELFASWVHFGFEIFFSSCLIFCS